MMCLSNRRGGIRGIIVPTIAILLGIGVLATDALRVKKKQLGKYAIPNDPSAKSLLAFMRQMDGALEFPRNFWESSNVEAVSHAVTRAYRALESAPGSLTHSEQREADSFYIYYSGALIGSGQSDDPSGQLSDLGEKAIQFIDSAESFTTIEQNTVLGMVHAFEAHGNFAEELEFVRRTRHQLSRFAGSLAAIQTSESLEGVQNRLELVSSTIQLESRSLDQAVFDAEDLRGKVVLIEFYGTRCIPCIEDLPALRRIYGRYNEDGFEVVGICLNAPASRIRNFVNKHSVPWTQLCHDIAARQDCNKQLADRFGVQSVPTTLLVDRKGQVVALGVRPLSPNPKQDLETLIQRLLAP